MKLPPPFDGWWLAIKGAWAVIRTVLFLALALWFGLFMRACGKQASATELQQLRTTHAEAIAKAEKQRADLATEYRATERRMGQDFIAAATQHTEEMRRAHAQSTAVLAGLRAGTLRLQEHWTHPMPGTPAAAADPRSAANAAERRATDTATLVGIGDEFDAFAALCHRTLIAERRSN